jgi:hypothetical protein
MHVLTITIEGDSKVIRACSVFRKIMMEDAFLIGCAGASEGNPFADVWIPLLVMNQRATYTFLTVDTN